MNPFSYVKSHGIKGTWDVIYKYKIDQLLKKIAIKVTSNKPLKDSIIIEGHGDFDSNGGAFYNYLINNGYNKKYKIIWLLKYDQSKELPDNVETYPLFKPSYKKNKAIATAKYILTCNNAIGSIRPDQISVYLSHGSVALKKTVGLTTLPKNLKYSLAPSEFWKPVLSEVYKLSDQTKQIIVGYPIHDMLYTPSNHEVRKVTTKEYKKIILWMPTFRKGGGLGRNDSDIDYPLGIPLFRNITAVQELNDYLKKYNSLLIIKIHPKQDMSTVKIKDMSNIIVLDGQLVRKLDIDNYRLMKDTDALVSDYSSAAFDYLHLNRPVAFVLDDLEHYKIPLVDNYEDLIMGPKIYRQEDLKDFILQVINNNDQYVDRRKTVFDKVFKYHDGDSCKRLANFLNLQK